MHCSGHLFRTLFTSQLLGSFLRCVHFYETSFWNEQFTRSLEFQNPLLISLTCRVDKATPVRLIGPFVEETSLQCRFLYMHSRTQGICILPFPYPSAHLPRTADVALSSSIESWDISSLTGVRLSIHPGGMYSPWYFQHFRTCHLWLATIFTLLE